MANGLGFYNKDFLIIKEDKELVAESITRIVMTNPGERVGQPYFGVGLRNLLFEQLDTEFETNIKDIIYDQIGEYEPRATITNIETTEYPEDNKIAVSIGFKLVGEEEENANILKFDFDLE